MRVAALLSKLFPSDFVFHRSGLLSSHSNWEGAKNHDDFRHQTRTYASFTEETCRSCVARGRFWIVIGMVKGKPEALRAFDKDFFLAVEGRVHLIADIGKVPAHPWIFRGYILG